MPTLDGQPDDYFLFSAADVRHLVAFALTLQNDFITATGKMFPPSSTYADGYATATGQDVPNQVFVFRVTMPGIAVPSYLNAPTASGTRQRRSILRERRLRLARSTVDSLVCRLAALIAR